jgi:oxygen-independent coproporphyrinogen-3 oxidase
MVYLLLNNFKIMSKIDSIKSCISTELIRKYNTAVPRYTSYPSAPNFKADYCKKHYALDVKHSNESLLPRNLSLYIHIPFCHSLCYFCGCNKIITKCTNAKVDNYFDSLLKEISLRAELFDSDRRVTQIHFGGGTPNFFKNDRLAEILDKISSEFHLHLPSRVELSIEIDPRSISPEGIFELANIGFNRFSIGVQDFAKDVQLAVNRVQSEQSTLEVIAAACSVSNSVNVDLITGLPKQNPQGFKETLEKIIHSDVTRIAAYNFAYLPESIKAQRLIDESALPDANVRMELMQITRNTLLNSGFTHIGMDHFAKSNDSLVSAFKNNTLHRNFQGYSTHAETDLVGLGISAISQFKSSFSQNTNSIKEYTHSIEKQILPIKKGVRLSNDDVLRAIVIQQVMCRNSVDLNLPIRNFIDAQHTETLQHYFYRELAALSSLSSDNLISFTRNGFDISQTGRFFRRQIASFFDIYFSENNHQNLSKKNKIIQFSHAL